MCERRGVEGSKKDVMVEIDDIMDQSLEESLMIVYVNVPVSSEIVNTRTSPRSQKLSMKSKNEVSKG